MKKQQAGTRLLGAIEAAKTPSCRALRPNVPHHEPRPESRPHARWRNHRIRLAIRRFANFRYLSVSFACMICASVTWLLRKRACGFASPMGSEIAPFGHSWMQPKHALQA